jgi:hypothetical protein
MCGGAERCWQGCRMRARARGCASGPSRRATVAVGGRLRAALPHGTYPAIAGVGRRTGVDKHRDSSHPTGIPCSTGSQAINRLPPRPMDRASESFSIIFPKKTKHVRLTSSWTTEPRSKRLQAWSARHEGDRCRGESEVGNEEMDPTRSRFEEPAPSSRASEATSEATSKILRV